jgi:hypothetical protein
MPPYGAGLIGTHLVYLPSYLNIRVLPVYLKKEIESHITNFCSKNMHDLEFKSNPYGLQRWMGMIKYMLSDDWSRKLPSTIEYLETCDASRGTDFRKIFPELSNLR